MHTQIAPLNPRCLILFIINQVGAPHDIAMLMPLLNLRPIHSGDLTRQGGDDHPIGGLVTDVILTEVDLHHVDPLDPQDANREVRGEKGYPANDTIAHHHRLAPLVAPTNSLRVVLSERLNTSLTQRAINGLPQESAATETLANFYIRLKGTHRRKPMSDKLLTLHLKFKHLRLILKRPFMKRTISLEVILTHATIS